MNLCLHPLYKGICPRVFVKSEKFQQKATVQVVGNKKKIKLWITNDNDDGKAEPEKKKKKRREGTAVKHDDVWIDVGV